MLLNPLALAAPSQVGPRPTRPSFLRPPAGAHGSGEEDLPRWPLVNPQAPSTPARPVRGRRGRSPATPLPSRPAPAPARRASVVRDRALRRRVGAVAGGRRAGPAPARRRRCCPAARAGNYARAPRSRSPSLARPGRGPAEAGRAAKGESLFDAVTPDRPAAAGEGGRRTAVEAPGGGRRRRRGGGGVPGGRKPRRYERDRFFYRRG